MIELFFEVGPGKPTIHVPIQVFIFLHIHVLLFHPPFGYSSIYTSLWKHFLFKAYLENIYLYIFVEAFPAQEVLLELEMLLNEACAGHSR